MSDKKQTLFQKIMNGDLPGEFFHDDEHCVAIKDKYPDAPLHLLIIPKKPIPSIADLEEEDRELVSHMIFVAKNLAKEQGCGGYRLQFNVGKKGGQVIHHIHLHLLGWY